MSARKEVVDCVSGRWVDPHVANWAIDTLAILEHAETKPACPTYQLSFENGLIPTNTPINPIDDFKSKLKYAISGGFEGTKGHVQVLSNVDVSRILTLEGNNPVVLLLEPDSYIVRRKSRDPIVNLDQRVQMWSTSGLVDVVVALPDSKDSSPPAHHYLKIHNILSPVNWCTSVENPNWREIITRHDKNYYDLLQLYRQHKHVHTSFLVSTKNLSLEKFREVLRAHVYDLVGQTDNYVVSNIIPQGEMTEIILKRIAPGLY